MNSYEKIYNLLVEGLDSVGKATSSQVRTYKKIMARLSHKQIRVFNRAMTTKDSEGNWRSSREANRLARKAKK